MSDACDFGRHDECDSAMCRCICHTKREHPAESVSGEPPRCISCQQPLMSKDGKSWCSTPGCSAQFQPISSGGPPRAEPPTVTMSSQELLAGSRPSAPAREGLCEDCGNEYPTPWFVSNDIWNQVVELSADPKHFLCMHCFVKRADKVIRCTGWEIVPENLAAHLRGK